jgi:protein SCO1
MNLLRRSACPLLCFLLVAAVRVPLAAANPAPSAPDLVRSAGIDQRLGAQLPLATVLRDSGGQLLRLRQALGGKPAVLVLGYYRCTNLCEAVRAGVAQAVAASGLRPGEQFNLVILSIDPRESAADAAAAKRADEMEHPKAGVAAWRYLVGISETASALVEQAVGFRVVFDPRTGQYAHAAGIVVMSASGQVTQYLLGVRFAPLTLRLALVSASRGRIGSPVDRLVLLCSTYDSATGHYSLLISRILQGLGVLTFLTLAGLVAMLRHRELGAQKRWPV